MSDNQIVTVGPGADVLEKVVVGGDLSKLTAPERLVYYRRVCESVGLNPLTRPFEYITLNGKLTLYARKDATDQMRAERGISITKLERETVSGAYVVTAYARSADGREDSSIGAVSIEGLKGDALCNAMMKAETKAKRRVTLSIGGLGMLDETELETVPTAKTVVVTDAGEILDAPKSEGPRTAWDNDGNSQHKFEAYLATNNVSPTDFYAFMAVPDWAGYIAKTPTKAQAVKDANAYMEAKKQG